jgi:CO/xanthine dehydrogenase Mo-binding subunit
VRAELAVVFGLPEERVRVEVPYVGGGFGSKSYAKLEPVTVALARCVGRPVRLVGRVEDAMVTTRRHAMRCRMRTTARRDGTLVARWAEILMDTGAYADNGPTVTTVAAIAAVGPYRWQHIDIDAACVYTHLPPAGSYRGFGGAHLQWIGESQVDELAERLGIDRLEMRRRNLLGRGETFVPGLKPVDADLPGDLDALAKALGWPADDGALRGTGLSVGLTPAGVSADSTARVELDAAGRVTVHVGSQEIGQGARTVHAQIAAEVLDLPVERVVVAATDTGHTPYDRSTGASRSTTVAGLAVARAAEDLRAALLRAAAERAGVSPDELVVREGAVVHDEQLWPFTELGPAVGHGNAAELAGTAPPPALFWEVCMAGARVAVDPRTGRVDVERVVTVADVGRAINPSMVERQDEGCVAQALGNAFFEELHFDEDGVLRNDSLLGYRVPTAADMPAELECLIVENGDGPGPFGARGCGEGAFGGVLGALVCAVRDAGVPVTELPMTPDRVWCAARGGAV